MGTTENTDLSVLNKWREASRKLQICQSPTLAHFGDADGFTLKLTDHHHQLSEPILEITPIKSVGQVSISVPKLKILLSRPHKLQGNVSLECQAYGVSGKQVFSYLQSFHGPSELSNEYATEGRITFVDIFVPGLDESLGWIKYIGDTSHGNVTMIDRASRRVLMMEAINEDNYIKISDINGANVALLERKRGLKRRISGAIKWTDWKIKYIANNQSSASLPSSLKLIILVASIMVVQSEGSGLTTSPSSSVSSLHS